MGQNCFTELLNKGRPSILNWRKHSEGRLVTVDNIRITEGAIPKCTYSPGATALITDDTGVFKIVLESNGSVRKQSWPFSFFRNAFSAELLMPWLCLHWIKKSFMSSTQSLSFSSLELSLVSGSKLKSSLLSSEHSSQSDGMLKLSLGWLAGAVLLSRSFISLVEFWEFPHFFPRIIRRTRLLCLLVHKWSGLRFPRSDMLEKFSNYFSTKYKPCTHLYNAMTILLSWLV